MDIDDNLCYNCFENKPDTEGSCPFCGYDAKADEGKFPMSLKPGSILRGEFILGRVLGQGGFGITYLGLDKNLRAKVAIKEYLPEGFASRSPGATLLTKYSGDKAEQFEYGEERFLEEAQTLAKFNGNKNVVGVRSFFKENGTAYFVMEYLEGISFKSYIANNGGKIGYEDALRVAAGVCDALSAVHQEGFIHRDVTPDNIYIAKNNDVKLLDFGAAKFSIGAKSKSLDVILKPGYAPREQYLRRGKQGPYTDIYSLAATIYSAITGYIPPESLERAEEDTIVDISAYGVKIPGFIDDAIMKGLEVKAEDRFQNAADFKNALLNGRIADASEGSGGYVQPQPIVSAASAMPARAGEGVSAQPQKPKADYKIIIGIAAAALVIVIAAVIIFSITGDSKNEPYVASGGGGGDGGDIGDDLQAEIESGAEAHTEETAPSFEDGFDSFDDGELLSSIDGQREMSYIDMGIEGIYNGNLTSGIPNGYGTFTANNGELYEGQWIDGLRAGNGIMHFLNGDVYEGNWTSGNISGYGTMTYSDGGKYIGNWAGGYPSGQGTYVWRDNSKFDGFFTTDVMGNLVCHDGVFTSSNGSMTGTGQFSDGLFTPSQAAEAEEQPYDLYDEGVMSPKQVYIENMHRRLSNYDTLASYAIAVDTELNAIYQMLRDTLSANDAEALRSRQIDWIRAKEAEIERQVSYYGASTYEAEDAKNSVIITYTEPKLYELIDLYFDR